MTDVQWLGAVCVALAAVAAAAKARIGRIHSPFEPFRPRSAPKAEGGYLEFILLNMFVLGIWLVVAGS